MAGVVLWGIISHLLVCCVHKVFKVAIIQQTLQRLMECKKETVHQLRLHLEYWANLAIKAQTRYSPSCHFQKDVWGFFTFQGYSALKNGASTAGFTPLHPLESQKDHLLTSDNKWIWHTAPILFALTWPDLCLAPCFYSCGLGQISWMLANTSGLATLGPHLWHPGSEMGVMSTQI